MRGVARLGDYTGDGAEMLRHGGAQLGHTVHHLHLQGAKGDRQSLADDTVTHQEDDDVGAHRRRLPRM